MVCVHVAIITKPSPHYVPTESISGRDVVLIPGLLPIFLHGCEIKSGRGLGTRLHVAPPLFLRYFGSKVGRVFSSIPRTSFEDILSTQDLTLL